MWYIVGKWVWINNWTHAGQSWNENSWKQLERTSWHISMMTSSNGNIFRVTGHLCGEFTGPGEFPAQRPVTRSFDVFFDLCLNKRLSKQPWGWWFETPSRSLWRHCNVKRTTLTKMEIFIGWGLKYSYRCCDYTIFCISAFVISKHFWIQCQFW